MNNIVSASLGFAAAITCSSFFRSIESVFAPRVRSGESPAVKGPEPPVTVDFAGVGVTTQERRANSPLVIAIGDVAASMLNDPAFKRLEREVQTFTKSLLAEAFRIAAAEQKGNPAEKLTEEHISTATPSALESLATTSVREKGFRTRIRELTLLFLGAGVTSVTEGALTHEHTGRLISFGIGVSLILGSAVVFFLLGE
jgi:hypothetical protein